MAQFDEIGRVYRKRKESAWPTVVTVVIIFIIIGAAIG